MKKLTKIMTLGLLMLCFTCSLAFAYKADGKSDLSIKWFGHSSFGISDSNGLQIVTDPYNEVIGYKFPKVDTNILTSSHDHFDHNNIKVVNSYKHLVNGLGKFSYDKIDIKGIETVHDDKNGTLRGMNRIYTFKMDQLRICHLGDLGRLLTAEEKIAIGKVDILMIPVGGLYTIDAENAAAVVRQLSPKVVLPMHYKTDALIPQFGPVTDIEPFLAEMKGWTVEKADVLDINKADLAKSKDKKIVVLSYK